MSHSDIQQIESEETRYKIFELRKAGWSHAQIANALNCTRHHISQLLRKELETTRTLADAALDDLRTLELARLDEATKSIWPRVLNADTRAIDIFLKISERRAKLTGMDAPERTLSIDLTQQLERLSPTDLLQEATRLGLPLPANHITLLPISLPGEVSPIKIPGEGGEEANNDDY